MKKTIAILSVLLVIFLIAFSTKTVNSSQPNITLTVFLNDGSAGSTINAKHQTTGNTITLYQDAFNPSKYVSASCPIGYYSICACGTNIYWQANNLPTNQDNYVNSTSGSCPCTDN